MIFVDSIDDFFVVGLKLALLKFFCQYLMTVFDGMNKFLVDSCNMLDIRLVTIDPAVDAFRKLGEGNA